MSKSDQEFIIIGQLGRAHGVKGWMKFHAFTESVDSMMSYDHLFIEDIKNTFEPFDFEDIKLQGNGIIVKIKGIDDPESIDRYKNKKIAILRKDLPELEKGEYYWTDLEGLEVFDKQGEKLGVVDYVFNTGPNDVLAVKGEKQHLIPFLQGNVILEIDLENKKIHVDWDKDF